MGDFMFHSPSLCWKKKAKQKKNPLDEELYLSTGYFCHLHTQLFLQIRKEGFLPPRANNQSTNPKETCWARATALCFTARHGPRRTNSIVECGRAILIDVRATLKLGTQVFLKPILISSNHNTGPKFLNPFLLFVLKQSWQRIGLLIYRTVHQAWLPWKTCFPNYFQTSLRCHLTGLAHSDQSTINLYLIKSLNK